MPSCRRTKSEQFIDLCEQPPPRSVVLCVANTLILKALLALPASITSKQVINFRSIGGAFANMATVSKSQLSRSLGLGGGRQGAAGGAGASSSALAIWDGGSASGRGGEGRRGMFLIFAHGDAGDGGLVGGTMLAR